MCDFMRKIFQKCQLTIPLTNFGNAYAKIIKHCLPQRIDEGPTITSMCVGVCTGFKVFVFFFQIFLSFNFLYLLKKQWKVFASGCNFSALENI